MSSPTYRRLALWALLGLAPLAGCECTGETYELPHRVESFRVQVKSVQSFSSDGSTSFKSWSQTAPMGMPRVGALLEVEVTALDEAGVNLLSFQKPISFRVTPGHVVAAGPLADPLVTQIEEGNISVLRKTDPRMLEMRDGVARGFVLVEKVFGPTVLWAQDSPPAPVFVLPSEEGDDENAPLPDAGVEFDAGPSPEGLDAAWQEHDGGRTYAAGVSDPLWFASPSLADTQLLPGKEPGFPAAPGCQQASPGWNNKASPFVGNFLTIDTPYPAGDMIVSAIFAEGFYCTDLISAPVNDPFYTDDPTGHRTMPGTFGHMYVYNYNYPDNLFVGDRVHSVTGTVQEFSGDTQMVFPSWVRKEGLPRLQDLPKPYLLDFSSYTDTCAQGDPLSHCDSNAAPRNSLRCVHSCGGKSCPPGFVCNSDQQCACQTVPYDSCAATIPGSRCDASQNKCVGTCPESPCSAGQWCVQQRCVKPSDPCGNVTCPIGERCNSSTGACECGPTSGYRLSKTATWKAVPAPASQWMEQLFAYSNKNIEIESLESAVVKLYNILPSTVFTNCDANGNGSIPPFRWNVPNGPDGCGDFNGASWFCDPNGKDTEDCECNRDCVTGRNAFQGKVCSELNTFQTYGQWLVQLEDQWQTRINVSTRDAIPELDPREFGKPEYAGCRVDITGILRQVQAARPRWLILARDEQDVCCRAESGSKCPTPENGGKCPKCPDAEQ
ncbi:MAG: hypothetical protein HY901_04875 [Deltaproteobacteria bacterium]|nr:hypothetical protein [Deltaproteobacteria bacterium]